jgi:hypothetical protein
MSTADGGPEGIGWLPVLGEEGHPLTTFGLGGWHDGEQVDVPELGLAGVDSEIAPLVLALNRAGIETVQSCQDLGGATSPGPLWGDRVPRIGAVVVTWETFPSLRQMLAGLGTGVDSGWLFSVSDVSSGAGLFVSVLFPWRDAEAFLAAVEGLALPAPAVGRFPLRDLRR